MPPLAPLAAHPAASGTSAKTSSLARGNYCQVICKKEEAASGSWLEKCSLDLIEF
jgi:hypothetical protein